VPVPLVIIPLGLRVKAHESVFGKPLNTTLPVETLQLGCVITPTMGVLAVQGTILMVIFRLFSVKSGALGFVT
jgi:hypothetical protein